LEMFPENPYNPDVRMAEDPRDKGHEGDDRRTFLEKASRGAMAAGLIGGYGGLGAIALRYLYPSRPEALSWQFVIEEEDLRVGESLLYRGPSGETINIARQSRDGGADDFVALSSTCPHLGCQVRWEAQNSRFFCPCHNGVFDATGKGIGGPPGEAGQSLAQYPLRVEGGLLHIAVPTVRLVDGTDKKGEILAAKGEISGPGHDPCLGCQPPTNRRRRA
jgi:nitrite reductase/ring-hydroxylating ferredoxin subunit